MKGQQCLHYYMHILLAEMVSESSVLSLPQLRSLNKDWYFAAVKTINYGNSIYVKHVSALGTLLDVEDVSDLFKRKFGCHNLPIPSCALLCSTLTVFS